MCVCVSCTQGCVLACIFVFVWMSAYVKIGCVCDYVCGLVFTFPNFFLFASSLFFRKIFFFSTFFFSFSFF